MSMSFLEVVFLISFLALVGISFYRLLNVLRVGSLYDNAGAWAWFSGTLFSWLLVLISFLNSPGVFTVGLFSVANFLLGINVLFLLVELFYFLPGATARQNTRYLGRK